MPAPRTCASAFLRAGTLLPGLLLSLLLLATLHPRGAAAVITPAMLGPDVFTGFRDAASAGPAMGHGSRNGGWLAAQLRAHQDRGPAWTAGHGPPPPLRAPANRLSRMWAGVRASVRPDRAPPAVERPAPAPPAQADSGGLQWYSPGQMGRPHYARPGAHPPNDPNARPWNSASVSKAAVPEKRPEPSPEPKKPHNKPGEECAICMNKEEPEKHVYCKRCHTPFHATCLQLWLTSSPVGGCPNCRLGYERHMTLSQITVAELPGKGVENQKEHSGHQGKKTEGTGEHKGSSAGDGGGAAPN